MLTTGFYDPVSGQRLRAISVNGRADLREWVDLAKIEMPEDDPE